ncbi:DapH/DapD/GlmU-related protein [Candidatus Enterococcus moelleringii]|uniref:DapH/DapD/GlmU-related protein n=1 Tax=Candidatus Enterococcus moelleringii TaxID=2815325 RepID=UPI001F60FD83|nr:DapH/DapD/GlmU-related protein [Enterococcus sp. 669A]
MTNKQSIFDKAKQGERLNVNSPEFSELEPVLQKGVNILKKFNTEQNTDQERRELLAQLFDQEIAPSTTIMPPFNVDFANQVTIGKDVYINKDVSFVALGTIHLEDGVLIAAKASIVSINHVEKPSERQDLLPKVVHIKENAWIGAGAIVLPGVTVGKNAIVGAGAVVTRDVPDDTVVAGNPAREIRKIRC